MAEVENAYDVMFMHAMRRRLAGEVEVSTSVRWADVPGVPQRKGSGRVRGNRTALGIYQEL
jgi:hypothetical protein